MDIKYALLGFLSWQPFSGYDLKKMLEDSELFYWSGNNNQIYTGLVQLHKEGLVESEAQPSEKMPNRKVYRITAAGSMEFRRWLLTEPEMPQWRKPFLIRLAWSEGLNNTELESQLSHYEYELKMRLTMLKEQRKRGVIINPARSPRERYIWEMIFDNYTGNYQSELDWVAQVKQELKRF